MNPFPASRRLWILGLNENLRAGMMVKGEVLECEKVTDEFRPAWQYSRPADELQLEAMTVTGVETASSTWICVDPGCKLEESDWGSVHGPVDRPFSIRGCRACSFIGRRQQVPSDELDAHFSLGDVQVQRKD